MYKELYQEVKEWNENRAIRTCGKMFIEKVRKEVTGRTEGDGSTTIQSIKFPKIRVTSGREEKEKHFELRFEAMAWSYFCTEILGFKKYIPYDPHFPFLEPKETK